ncbi:MAG TPA: FAD-dependent oxidoreductase [Tepidisphaeraceae bacterium]|nr:FAD-dependent oxidoreductase [Tepidisphaeraceae bacterium]
MIGCEYASIFATLGVRVTLVDMRPKPLPFVDDEIAETLAYHLRENRVTLRLGEQVSGIEPVDDASGQHVRIQLASGKPIVSDAALHSIGRTGATPALNLAAANLAADDRGRLKVNRQFQTEVPHI